MSRGVLEFVEKEWQELMLVYKASDTQTRLGWEELFLHYQSPQRAYHNFTHIATLLTLGNEHAIQLSNPPLLKLSIFYHDIIYKALRKDNEAKSAELAIQRLKALQLKEADIATVDQQIRATAGHDLIDKKDLDAQWFLDFDLEILSRPWEEYLEYTHQIRKEYRLVPGYLYRKGRKKVLAHFLEKPYLYHTAYFQKHKEAFARQNLLRELEV